MQEVSGETDDVLHWFLTEREDIWTPWVSADVAQRVKAAIAG
jgi:glycine betaine/proline transport system substrate-binding protein